MYSSYTHNLHQDYVRKINNTVWSCCILHNLLLAYDGDVAQGIFSHHLCNTLLGLDKLWTEDDYLSCWYADADAEIHPVYDRVTANHDALIRSRADARLRKFNARTVLGERRPFNPAPPSGPERYNLVPDTSVAAQLNLSDGVDQDPLEWHHDFKSIQKSLIEHFDISWNKNRVQWLPFPGSSNSKK